jgi:predicted aminopeptidase
MGELDKRAAKEAAFRQLREDYARLKHAWNGYSGYDRWFDEPINNAKLISVAAYSDLVPLFQRMLAEAGNDLPAFYLQVGKLARLPKAERLARLGDTGSGS